MTWKNSGSWKICQALNNICKTLLHCFSKQAAEAEEKSQVVIQKSSASFSNGKNDDRAQNSQLLNLLLSATRFLPALFHLKRVRQALCQFVNSWENAFHLRERSEQLVFSIFISKSWVWKKRGKLISRFFFKFCPISERSQQPPPEASHRLPRTDWNTSFHFKNQHLKLTISLANVFGGSRNYVTLHFSCIFARDATKVKDFFFQMPIFVF